MESKNKSCKNCNQVLVGQFCSNCGQKASVNQLTLHEFFHEVWHSFTHTDSGILKLIKDLLISPKRVYLGYFDGQRKKYFSPVKFFLITATVLVLIGIKIFDYEDYKLNSLNEFGRYVFEKTKFKTLIILPFSILLTWLFSYKQFNVAKNSVFWFFVYGFLFTIKIAFSPVYFLFINHKNLIDDIIIITQFLVMFYHLCLVFANRNWLRILVCFVIVNVIWIVDFLLSAYLLFGVDILNSTNSTNLLDLITKAYKF